MPTSPKVQDADALGKGAHGHGVTLQIFVNRRKFDENDGVQPTMTGAEIAALVKVPRENAVVELETGPNKGPIGIDQTVQIENGQHFLATRKVVEGGAHA